MWAIFEILGCRSRKNKVSVENVSTNDDSSNAETDEYHDLVNRDATDTTDSSESMPVANDLGGCEVVRVKYGENKEYDEACFEMLEKLLNPYVNLKGDKLRIIQTMPVRSVVCDVSGIDVMVEFNKGEDLGNIVKNIVEKAGGLKYKFYLKGTVIVFKRKSKLFRKMKANEDTLQYVLNIRTDFNRSHDAVIFIECDA